MSSLIPVSKSSNGKKNEDEDSRILYSAETLVPVVTHYVDVLHAERMLETFKKFFQEWYQLAEIKAFEITSDIPLKVSLSWEKAPDYVSDLMLEMMTEPCYAKYLNEEYPDTKDGFGPKIINISAFASIFVDGDGDRVLMFAGNARVGIQSAENKHQYTQGDILKTVF